MRILVLADDCNPEWPSLPVVGYKAARALANHADVVVATHIRNRENIEKRGFGSASVRYFDNEYIARPFYSIAKAIRGGTATAWTMAMALAYPSYIAFEWEVWKATRYELRRGEFDIVHRLTPMSPTLPSPLAKWSPVPFVLGPLNGGLRWPPGFHKELAREGEWLSYVRGAYRLLPFQRSTYRNASAILGAFPHTIDDLPKRAGSKTINFPEVGIDPGIFCQIANTRAAKDHKTILFVGRLVPYKLPQIVVKAFAKQPALHEHKLIIVGDGPERAEIERLISEHDLENRIEVLGWKSQPEVASLMRAADIFAFPSIRELGAGVVLEAMASGLACIVVDYGGPGTLIDTDRGIKVPLGDSDKLVDSFGRAMVQLVSDESTLTRLAASARQHALQFYTWDAKALKTIAVYDWVLGRGPRPNFWD